MKRMTLLAAFAALSSLVSCQKEEAVNGNGEMKVIYPEFTASIGTEETKTTVDLQEGKVSWESSDTIIVSDGENSAVYKIKSIDGSTGKATFEVKDNTQPVLSGSSFTATYGTEPSTSQTYSSTAGGLYMTAPSTSNKSFTFTVACGLMKLNLTKTGESVKSIAVTGTPTGGSQATYTLTCETAESIDAAKDFCIALPAGNYNKIVITDNTGKICILNASTALSVNNNKIRPVTIVDAKINFNLLGGVFSVSADKKVRFSKGNLYYDGSSFNFESAQYSYPTIWNTFHVGHFIWSNNASSACAVSWNWSGDSNDIFFTNDQNSGVNGQTLPNPNFTVSGEKGIWRTLSSIEWQYLLGISTSQRSNASSMYGFGTVAGKKGLIILPDIFADPKTNDGNKAFVSSATRSWTANIYTLGGNWEAMENAGAVFLPAAGSRSDTTISDNGGKQDYSYYWSTTPNDDMNAVACDFSTPNAGPKVCMDGDIMRGEASPVRLVRE